MRDADDLRRVRERELQHLVRVDAAAIREAEEGVVREDGFVAHGARVEEGLMHEGGEGLVPVDEGDPLPEHDVAEEAEVSEDGGKGVLAVEGQSRDVVHLEAPGHEPDAGALAVRM
eukprot:6805427-Pyramimonas_sp.AAC.1